MIQQKKLRKKLETKDPEQIAVDSGARYLNGDIRLKLFNRELKISPDEFAVEPLSGEVEDHLKVLILNYLSFTENPAGSDEWVGFREIPHGEFYSENFKKNTELKLTRTFQSKKSEFEAVSAELGGEEIDMGDSGYAFRVLPKIRLALVFWSGGDEFQDKINFLFEKTAIDCLTTEGISILGKEFCKRFIEKAKGEI
ncbi:DUF3786 domain-containing protein [Candidatus Bipolaricaulota bacterium]|nr:DUF3786 domain-containing protein [Candidatus Bipolaricaulota bacterium]